MTDPVSDMLIRIKNAQGAGHEFLYVTYSKFKLEMVRALSRAGFVGQAEVRGKRVRKSIEIGLLYKKGGEPFIRQVKLISKPSRRLFTSYKDLKKSRYGGLLMLTTSRGVLSAEEARKDRVGGQLIAEFW